MTVIPGEIKLAMDAKSLRKMLMTGDSIAKIGLVWLIFVNLARIVSIRNMDAREVRITLITNQACGGLVVGLDLTN